MARTVTALWLGSASWKYWVPLQGMALFLGSTTWKPGLVVRGRGGVEGGACGAAQQDAVRAHTHARTHARPHARAACKHTRRPTRGATARTQQTWQPHSEQHLTPPIRLDADAERQGVDHEHVAEHRRVHARQDRRAVVPCIRACVYEKAA
jgi:hypothetical protein